MPRKPSFRVDCDAVQPIKLIWPLTRGVCANLAALFLRVRIIPRDPMPNALRPRIKVLHAIPTLHRGRRPLLGDENIILCGRRVGLSMVVCERAALSTGSHT